MDDDLTPWHRRLALMIVHKLPDDPEDARKVLELVHDLLDDYHAGKRRKRKRPALGVVPMPVTSIRISGAFSDVRAATLGRLVWPLLWKWRAATEAAYRGRADVVVGRREDVEMIVRERRDEKMPGTVVKEFRTGVGVR